MIRYELRPGKLSGKSVMILTHLEDDNWLDLTEEQKEKLRDASQNFLYKICREGAELKPVRGEI